MNFEGSEVLGETFGNKMPCKFVRSKCFLPVGREKGQSLSDRWNVRLGRESGQGSGFVAHEKIKRGSFGH